jgi:nucleotide-binding universal stress UspA family protein
MYRHLLVPVDDSELSDRAMSDSVALARRLHARITGFVAEPAAPTDGTGYGAVAYTRAMKSHDARTAEHARAVLSRFEQRAQDAGVAFEGVYGRGDRVDAAILEAARAKACDLIVMCSHGRSALGELLFGSHTRNVLARSELPLLVLH